VISLMVIPAALHMAPACLTHIGCLLRQVAPVEVMAVERRGKQTWLEATRRLPPLCKYT
jgi:hypothetical protein